MDKMIELVINGIVYVKQLLYYGLVLSHGLGKGIIIGFKYVLCTFKDIFNSGNELLTVMSEDFLYFLNDILQKISVIVFGGSSFLSTTFNSVIYLIEMVKSMLTVTFITLSSALTSVWSGFFKIFTYIGVTITYIKNLTILFGLGIWFILKLVPLILMYIITLPLSVIGVIFQEIIEILKSGVTTFVMVIKSSLDFIFDMPFEAIAGLIAGACIVYILLKLKYILYRSVKEKCIRIVTGLIAMLSRIRRAGTVEPRKSIVNTKKSIEIPTKTENNYLSLDGCCVVCQEREKCILILPCKHLCLCNECSIAIQRYNRRCPVCRTYTQKTMKIYL